MGSTLRRRVMAAWCAVCPFCVAARWFPKSAYSKTLAQWERNCPCCKAYHEIKKEEKSESGKP